jgi:nucleoid DNA-binding protein
VELITNILNEYLKHNKRIVVPKLGTFIVKQSSGIIRFSELMRNDDGVLRSLLVAYGMSELEAIGKIDRFVFEIRHAVGQGNIYTLEGFGEFRPSENNTILFRHNSEPKVIGGNIKPPVEVLNVEKLKLRLESATMQQPAEESNTQSKRKTKSEIKLENTLTSNKPDAYLRGLNYDDRKKKHSEERSDKRRVRRAVSPFTLFIIMAIIALGIYGAWEWINNKNEVVTPEYEQSIFEEERALIDTLQQESISDSLLYTPTVIDSLELSINDRIMQ